MIEKKEKSLHLIWMFLRYIFLLLISLGGLYIFYVILTPLTLYASYFILKLITPASFALSISGEAIVSLSGHSIEIVQACVAGSAYYLLIILNLSTPMSLKKRFYSLVFSIASLFIINLLRIVIFSMLVFYNKTDLFNQLHLLFWYVLSIAFVLLVHFIAFKLFKIKEIPFYSDLKQVKQTYKSKSS